MGFSHFPMGFSYGFPMGLPEATFFSQQNSAVSPTVCDSAALQGLVEPGTTSEPIPYVMAKNMDVGMYVCRYVM